MYGYSTELYHHGVKGMKWGVRNYQNPDGTLTAEGRARYNIGGNLVRNASNGVTRFKKVGKDVYSQANRAYMPDLNKDGTGKYDSNGKLIRKPVYTGHRLRTKKEVADFYNIQRSATLSLIKDDAKKSVKEGGLTKKEARADYKAAKRDVDRVMSKYYGKTISEFANKQRKADNAAFAMGIALTAALPVAYIGANYLEKKWG